MTRDELLEDLAVVESQKRMNLSGETMAAVLRREQLIRGALETMDARAAIAVPTVRRFFVVVASEYFLTEAQAKNRASITYGGVVLAVDVPVTPTLTGTIIPETDP